jgi:hypothetical protein
MLNYFTLTQEIINQIRIDKQNSDLLVVGFDILSDEDKKLYLENKKDIIEFKLKNDEYPAPVQNLDYYMKTTKYIIHLDDKTVVV